MLIDKATFVLTFVAALGSGLIAGVFFIFSVAIIWAFERLPASEGIAAMQSIIIVIVNPIFLGVFIGIGVVCFVLAIRSLGRWEQPGSAWLLAGCLLYLIGSIGVTMVFNVPMNLRLAAADPASSAGQEIWAHFLTNWTVWNHVRMIASLAASASFMAALIYGDRSDGAVRR